MKHGVVHRVVQGVIRFAHLTIITLILSGVATSAALAADPEPMASTPLHGATLSLAFGMGRPSYWPSGFEGKIADLVAEKKFQARAWMAAHDGDWCLFLLKIDDPKDDSTIVVFDRRTAIVLTLEDSTRVVSDMTLAVDGPAEFKFWRADSTTLYFSNATSQFGRTLKSHSFPLYVRFPANSCLTDKGDGVERAFKAKPVNIAVTTKRGE